jgi:uncharacterized protein YjiS (DUF1127 family)
MSYSETATGVPYSGNNSLVEKVRTHLRNRRARKKVIALRDLDQRMLTDIGVTYDDIVWASKLPLSVNSAHDLDKVSRDSRSTNSRSIKRAENARKAIR